MSTIQVNNAVLKKHLYHDGYKVIYDKFGEDPSPLFRQGGVNYDYEGKVWNIRVGSQGNNSVNAVFIRVHSDSKTYGYKFKNVGVTRVHLRYAIFSHYQSNLGGSSPNLKNYSEVYDFMKILKDGVLNDRVGIPLVTSMTSRRCADFFRSCPQLIPPHSGSDDPRNIDPGLCNQSYLRIFVIVCGLATLYLVYKTIQETNSYFSGKSDSLRPLAMKVCGLAISSFALTISTFVYRSVTGSFPWQNN